MTWVVCCVPYNVNTDGCGHTNIVTSPLFVTVVANTELEAKEKAIEHARNIGLRYENYIAPAIQLPDLTELLSR